MVPTLETMSAEIDKDLHNKLAVDKTKELLALLEESFTDKDKMHGNGDSDIPHMVKFLSIGKLSQSITCSPIGLADGLVNFIYRLSPRAESSHSVVVKWARRVPRIQEIHDIGIDADCAYSKPERNVVECGALRYIESVVQGSTPHIYWADSKRFFFVMQDLRDSDTLTRQLDDGRVPPDVYRSVAQFLCNLHKGTHVNTLTSQHFAQLAHQFHNADSIEASVKWMAEDSFRTASINSDLQRRDNPYLLPLLPQILDNADIERIKTKLCSAMRDVKQCFIHNDTHVGFIMADRTTNSIKVIDAEFPYIGNPVKEIGHFLGDLLVWYYINLGRGKHSVCHGISDVAQIFVNEYIHGMGNYIDNVSEFMNYVAAFAGLFAALRTVNQMPYPPFDNLEVAEAECVEVAIWLMKEMDQVTTVNDFVAAAFRHK